jgi:hypothetical protein
MDRVDRVLGEAAAGEEGWAAGELGGAALGDARLTALLEPDEWRALYCITHRTTLVPPTPPPLRDAVRWIARLGGFLGRRGDGEPGPTVLWRGLQRLYDHTAMYRLMTSPQPAPTCG